MSLRDVSIRLTGSLSKEDKKEQGIFFTPKEARDVVFRILDQHAVRPKTVLEPSFGSGEFLEDAYTRYPKSKITGVELNKQLFEACTRPHIHNADFFNYRGGHDLILGNPPYFVIPHSAETLLCQSGRPNIFVQFLFKSIRDNLNDDGYLAFVLPTSLFNCVYYETIRKYLFENTTILAAELLIGDYIDTKQKTFALVLQKGKRNNDYFVEMNGNKYITPFYKELSILLGGSHSLSALGFSVKTGDVVWNQEKDKLSDTGTLLIYSSNFVTGTLALDNIKSPKKQYITGLTKPPLSGKTILINRGYGNTTYVLKHVLVDHPSYYAENHVNVIRPMTEIAKSNIEKVHASLRDERTVKFIHYFVGNGALSKSEIENCLPIWLG